VTETVSFARVCVCLATEKLQCDSVCRTFADRVAGCWRRCHRKVCVYGRHYRIQRDRLAEDECTSWHEKRGRNGTKIQRRIIGWLVCFLHKMATSLDHPRVLKLSHRSTIWERILWCTVTVKKRRRIYIALYM